MNRITLRELFEAGVHFGHKTSNWNPKMAPYLYGERRKIHIIDLDQTLPMMIEAVQFLRSVAESRGKILFVGTKYAARNIIKEQAQACGMPYVDHRWLGGMLTNYSTIRRSIKRLKDLEAMEKTGYDADLTKKEKLNITRERNKLSQTLGGIKDMRGLPDALFIIDVNQEKIAITEANRLGIPVIAVIDSNSNPDDLTYRIPGNDDAQRAIRLYCKTIADVVNAVRQEQMKKDAKKVAPTAKKEEEPKARTVKIKASDKESKTSDAKAKPKEAVQATEKMSKKTEPKATEKPVTKTSPGEEQK